MIKRKKKKKKEIKEIRKPLQNNNILGVFVIGSHQTNLCNLYKGVVDRLLQRCELLLSSLDLLLQHPALLLKGEQLLPGLDQLLLKLTYPLLLLLMLRL